MTTTPMPDDEQRHHEAKPSSRKSIESRAPAPTRRLARPPAVEHGGACVASHTSVASGAMVDQGQRRRPKRRPDTNAARPTTAWRMRRAIKPWSRWSSSAKSHDGGVRECPLVPRRGARVRRRAATPPSPLGAIAGPGCAGSWRSAATREAVLALVDAQLRDAALDGVPHGGTRRRGRGASPRRSSLLALYARADRRAAAERAATLLAALPADATGFVATDPAGASRASSA